MVAQFSKALLKRPVLAVAAVFAAFATPAHADVFEISSDGAWQQISKSPYQTDDALAGIEPAADADGKLPPVRLAAITAVGEAIAPPQGFTLPTTSISGQHAAIINAAAQQFGISPALVDAVMWQESRYNHHARSHAGAIGLMQLMPDTARHLGVNPHDPWQNVFGGAAYLRRQLDRFGNNVPLALAAYNAGPEAVAKYGGVPPYAETRNYVNVIMRRLNAGAR